MALPALTKTWQKTSGRFATTNDVQLDHQTLLLAIKNALIGFALNPWVVDGSGSAGTFAIDAVDRWTTPTTITWGNLGSSNVAWMILRNPAMNASGNDARIMLGCASGAADSSTYDGLYAQVKLNGQYTNAVSATQVPTGGTLFLEPRKTVSAAQFSQGWFHGQTSVVASSAVYWVVLHSTDGLNTRIMAWCSVPPAPSIGGLVGAAGQFPHVDLGGGDRCVMYASFETLVDVVPGVAVPYVYTWQTGNVSSGAASGYYTAVPLDAFSNIRTTSTSDGTCLCAPAGAPLSARWSIAGACDRGIGAGRSRPVGEGAGPNVFDGAIDAWDIVVARDVTGTMTEVGRIPDLYTIPELGAQYLNTDEAAPVWSQGPPGLAVPCGGTLFGVV